MFKEKGVLFATGLIGLLFIMYAGIKSYPYLRGPSLTVYEPIEGSHVGTSTFLLRGRALRAKELYLSGKKVTIDTEGNFSELFVSYSPYTILTIEAVDRHGKRAQQILTVIP